MKALRVIEYDQPIQVVEFPRPVPADNEVLVRVAAASVNPIDRYIALGYLRQYMSAPLTLGKDFAGEVVAVGSNVSQFKPGDAVYGMSDGTFAEYAAVKESETALQPASLDAVHAAAVPLAGLTAWQALFTTAGLQSGERVLVLGAAGAVGSAAVQLAKGRGATVIGYARANKADYVEGLGVDQFINADTQDFAAAVSDVDVVIDTLGGEFVEQSFSVLKPGGRFVTVAARVPEGAGEAHGITAVYISTQSLGADLAELTEVIDAGGLEILVHKTFPLDEAAAALFYKAEDGAPGKIVITTSWARLATNH